jgi:transcriptional regulator with XRE-family HTH domain
MVKERRSNMITLRAARVNKNLTREEAAKLLNISVKALAMYESGKTSPTVKVVKRMEDLYEVNYNDIDFLPVDTI